MELREGGATLVRMLGAWFAEGAWNCQSAAAPEIAEKCYAHAVILPVPLVYFGYTDEKRESGRVQEHPDVGWAVQEVTGGRARLTVRKSRLEEFQGKMRRMPLTNEELKEQLKVRYEINELKAIPLIGGEGSVACAIDGRLGLSRGAAGLALEELADARAWQVALCSILCAARFRCLVGGRLRRTSCG